MVKQLQEGEIKRTDLPTKHVMVQQIQFGLHSIAIENMLGIEKAKVYVRDYPHWESAFDAVMDKAGL